MNLCEQNAFAQLMQRPPPTPTHTPPPAPLTHGFPHEMVKGEEEGEAEPPSHSVHSVMNVMLLHPLKTPKLSHAPLMR